jgi:hypothetical protein
MLSRDRVKAQWQIVGLNGFAALFNLGLACMYLYDGRWLGVANLAAGAFSAWFTWTCWQKIPGLIAEQKQRVIDILSGKMVDNEAFW